MSSAVGFVFNFAYYIYRPVGIAFLGLFGIRNFFNFLLFSAPETASFRMVSFLAVMTYGSSGWVFAVRV